MRAVDFGIGLCESAQSGNVCLVCPSLFCLLFLWLNLITVMAWHVLQLQTNNRLILIQPNNNRHNHFQFTIFIWVGFCSGFAFVGSFLAFHFVCNRFLTETVVCNDFHVTESHSHFQYFCPVYAPAQLICASCSI